MDAGFLARRPVGVGWLGNPRVDWYKSSYDWVTSLSGGRFVCGMMLLFWLPEHFHGTQPRRTSLILVTILSMLVAAVDWIPYTFYVWSRRPTTIHRLSTPAAAACGLTISITIFALSLQTNDGEFGQCQWVAVIMFLMNLAQALVSTVGHVYFVHDKPLSLPSEYEPVCQTSATGGDDDDAGSDTELARRHPEDLLPDGELARAFARQRQKQQQGEVGKTSVRSRRPRQPLPREAQSARTVQIARGFSSAGFGHDTILWQTKGVSDSLPGLRFLAFLACFSILHMVIQLVRYVKAGGFCDTLCVFNNLYPTLWIVHIGVFFRLIKKRTSFRHRVWKKVTVAGAVSLANFAITIIWWVAFGLTKHGPQLFTGDKSVETWMAYNGIALGVATLFALFSIISVWVE
ncbi:hypothetical protein B0T16DRAFT_423645 [Cercophora newfieldiana]|uniref:Uncharacterized protein n=1 Tax=Cercophora newfieldiana TaxID=92897 RepID=A0AA40CJD7_9PEZI|nr:hypothetical protein B0T16DRAFT_423645 [Cercophora newfieldiana]